MTTSTSLPFFSSHSIPLEVASSSGRGRQRRCEIRSTGVANGDFQVDLDPTVLEQRRRAVCAGDWTWLRQVHGTDVVVVKRPGDRAGEVADGAIVSLLDAPIAVTTADCAPVVLVGSTAVAVVHAGWRGAEAGIIQRAIAALRAAGSEPLATILGPCIGPAHYEFGAVDLDRLADQFGESVRSRTIDGSCALDMAAVVRRACQLSGWPIPDPAPCTSSEAFFSHRTRGDRGRQTTVAWLEDS
jgi:YfiH family protein